MFWPKRPAVPAVHANVRLALVAEVAKAVAKENIMKDTVTIMIITAEAAVLV